MPKIIRTEIEVYEFDELGEKLQQCLIDNFIWGVFASEIIPEFTRDDQRMKKILKYAKKNLQQKLFLKDGTTHSIKEQKNES